MSLYILYKNLNILTTKTTDNCVKNVLTNLIVVIILLYIYAYVCVCERDHHVVHHKLTEYHMSVISP